MKDLLKQFKLKQLFCVDVETYYDDDYSLRKMPTTEYICDPRFELQTVAIQEIRWKKPRVFTAPEFMKWAKTVDWKSAGVLAHHAHFDGLILSRHCGIIPAFYFDSLSMARPVMPVHVGGSLKALTEAFGRPGKKYGAALVNVKGRRLKEFTKAELQDLKRYNGDDVQDTLFVFEQLLPHIPIDELRLIDATVRMYAAPRLLLDKQMLLNLERSEIERKQTLLDKLGADKKQLMSNEQFAELLEAAGVTPPMKLSPKTGKLTLALSKQDAEFKALLDHDDEVVRTLVEARFGVKSTSVETRAARFASRADFGPTPVYLNYWGAKTGRWSGGDKANWQNLKRGSDLRKAVYAPPGHKLLIADLSQIEARINAWFNGQKDIVEAFTEFDVILGYDADGEAIRRGPDVYKVAAARIYNKPIDKITKDERFIGKCCVLALGYGAGWARFAHMLRIGALGPPVDITDSLARDIVSAWRSANAFIVAGWKRANNNAKSAFLGQQRLDDGPISYIGKCETGLITMPNGTYIRYDKLKLDEEGITYANKFRRLKDGGVSEQRQRLYGGLLCIGEGTPVLTSRGWVPIEAVRATDLVHDGEEFVQHGGLVNNGVQHCVIVDGVYMTPDHEVLTDEGWKPALEEPQPYRPALRYVDGATSRWVGRQKDAMDVRVRVRHARSQSGLRGEQSCASQRHAELRVCDGESTPTTSHTRDEQTSSVRSVPLYVGALYQSVASGMEKLRRTWHQSVLTLASWVRHFLGRHGTNVPCWSDSGPHRQLQRVFTNKLQLADVARASAQPSGSTRYRRGCAGCTDGDFEVHTVLPNKPRVGSARLSNATKSVYDIIDCGPRQRFVVAGTDGPFIVHNCENVTQALARVVIVEHAVALLDELKSSQLTMTTHDELVFCVPNRSADKALRTAKAVMTIPPSWAPDLPLGVDAHLSDRYDK